ncbi:hypothetical protein HYPSUDRAFT_129671, partial [Hypholoma sublateritium FD-334 SS-4]
MFFSSKLGQQRSEDPSCQSEANTIKLWPCPGLTEADDERINQYLGRTQLGSGGGISERILADEMFGNLYSSLNPSQKDAVTLRQQQTHRWRNDHLHQRIFAIGETKCSENVGASVDGDSDGNTTIKPCIGCKALLSFPAFLTAITKQQPSDRNRAFIPRRHQNTAIGNMHIKILGLGDLLSEESDDSILLRFARSYAEGKFDKNQAFLEMLSVMVSRADREQKGRGLQNMYYPPAFDEW